jgi:hypothetical protein
MDLRADQSNSYRVEVSGWDASESFFVERTMLNWGRDEKKEIHLRSVLREGSFVFVRLLQPLTNGNNFPVAYQAQRIGPRDPEGTRTSSSSAASPSPALQTKSRETGGLRQSGLSPADTVPRDRRSGINVAPLAH